jgi:hypothetical protein
MLQSASLPRVFRLFRALGLRHLAVVNDTNEVKHSFIFLNPQSFVPEIQMYVCSVSYNNQCLTGLFSEFLYNQLFGVCLTGDGLLSFAFHAWLGSGENILPKFFKEEVEKAKQ